MDSNKTSIKQKLINCFLEVQKENLDALIGIKSTKKEKEAFAIKFLKRAFIETKGNYDNPTKEEYQKAINWLINTSPTVSNSKKADKHRCKMCELINYLEK